MTDGVIETGSSNGDLFGLARALDIVRANRDKTAQEIVDTVYKAVRSHTQNTPPTDDIAVIVIKVQSDESSFDQVKMGRSERSTGVTSQ
jgi:phosphoserine phosphatase RsbU/P